MVLKVSTSRPGLMKPNVAAPVQQQAAPAAQAAAAAAPAMDDIPFDSPNYTPPASTTSADDFIAQATSAPIVHTPAPRPVSAPAQGPKTQGTLVTAESEARVRQIMQSREQKANEPWAFKLYPHVKDAADELDLVVRNVQKDFQDKFRLMAEAARSRGVLDPAQAFPKDVDKYRVDRGKIVILDAKQGQAWEVRKFNPAAPKGKQSSFERLVEGAEGYDAEDPNCQAGLEHKHTWYFSVRDTRGYFKQDNGQVKWLMNGPRVMRVAGEGQKDEFKEIQRDHIPDGNWRGVVLEMRRPAEDKSPAIGKPKYITRLTEQQLIQHFGNPERKSNDGRVWAKVNEDIQPFDYKKVFPPMSREEARARSNRGNLPGSPEAFAETAAAADAGPAPDWDAMAAGTTTQAAGTSIGEKDLPF